MSASPPRLIILTGKGGVGKTVLSAGLGLYAAELGLRTLIVDTACDSGIGELLTGRAAQAMALPARLETIRLSPRQLVEDYFHSLLRFSFLSRRLFESSSFNALTAAAPGISEFLLLERILEWLQPGRRQSRYDLVVLDGPATGHAIKLLRAPRNIRAMVPAGPLASSARRMSELLTDARRTAVVVVAIPEELSVQETIETYRALRDDLHAPVSRPVVNRMFPQRFSKDEIAEIDAADPDNPTIAAAQFALARRREAERNVGRLRRALGVSPLQLLQQFEAALKHHDLRVLGERLARELEIEAASD